MRSNPTLADKIHCILYVIRATSNLSLEQTPSLKLMKEIKDKKNSEGNSLNLDIYILNDYLKKNVVNCLRPEMLVSRRSQIYLISQISIFLVQNSDFLYFTNTPPFNL